MVLHNERNDFYVFYQNIVNKSEVTYIEVI